ncbi:MAG: plastocyanin/azurin family copper-binding protein, partial [Bacteroidota bacterium]
MKCIYYFFFAFLFSTSAIAQTTHTVETFSFGFDPETLTIEPGDIVIWDNVQGNHNVNGTVEDFPDNPESFGNSVAPAPWTYEYTFNTVGVYNYHCDPHIPFMQGTVIVSDALSTNDVVLTGLEVYPSPAVDYFVLKGVDDFSGNNALQVFDITGKLVL